MSKQTPNYNLEKPNQDDFYNVNVQNGNMDKIDAALKTLDDKMADGVTHEDLSIIDMKLDKIDQGVNGIYTKSDQIKQNVDAIKTTTDATKNKVDTIDTRTATINENVNAINANVGQLLNGRVVKSVQRGLFNMSGVANGTQNVPIATVNLAKCDINFNGFFTSTGSTGSPSYQIYLSNVTSTQLTFQSIVNTSGNAYINWQVVEYY